MKKLLRALLAGWGAKKTRRRLWLFWDHYCLYNPLVSFGFSRIVRELLKEKSKAYSKHDKAIEVMFKAYIP